MPQPRRKKKQRHKSHVSEISRRPVDVVRADCRKGLSRDQVAEPKASVMRDGKLKTIPAEKLVRDDIVLFLPGSQICADAEVVYGEAKINESLLTGVGQDSYN